MINEKDTPTWSAPPAAMAAMETWGRKSPRRNKALAAVVCGVAVIAIATHKQGGSDPAPSASAMHSVTYKISGTASSGDLTFTTANGGTSQLSGIAPEGTGINAHKPSTVATYTMGNGDFAYLSIQNGGDSGSVTCTIEVDGVVAVTNTSSGAYVIADCSGTV